MAKKSNTTVGIKPAILGWLLTALAFMPGFFSPDPLEQFRQARSGLYSDWHPPLMAWVWSFLDRLIPGSGGMLLLHLTLFWAAVALLVSKWVESPRWRWALMLGFGFFPPVLSMLGIIWKDIGFGAANLLAVALVLFPFATPSKRRWARATALLCLFYGLSIRLNALPAMVPLFCLWVGTDKGLKSIAQGVVATLLCLVAAGVFQRVLIQNRKDYPIQQIYLYDLAAISLATGKNLFPPYLAQVRPGFSLEWVGRVHHPVDAGGIVNQGVLVKDAQQVSELASYWRRAVWAHLPIYLEHRQRIFKHIMSIHRGASETYTLGFWEEAPLPPLKRIKIQDHLLRRLVEPWLNFWVTSLLFSNGAYVLLICMLGWVGWVVGLRWGPREHAFWWVGLSGYLYTLAYFVVGTAGNFRYSWWTVLASMVMAGELLFRKNKGARS